jgi:ribosomal-protein-alanine N-acetyltransferase
MMRHPCRRLYRQETTMSEDPKPWFPIRTERLLLREFRVSDEADVHAYGSDPEVSRFMDWGPNDAATTREVMQRWARSQEVWPRDEVNLAVEHLADGRVIGSFRLGLKAPGHRTADFGHSYHRAYWRQGYAAEAARALFAVGFGDLGLHRIWATADVRNIASWRLLEKLGMRREAHFRLDVLVKAAWRDSFLYAILAEGHGRR